MAPVEESRERPAGKPGETVHEVIVPPLTVGVSVVMVVPFSRVSELDPYEIVGGTSLTTMVTLAVSVPPVLVAVIVYEAEEVTAVGVPEITPVEVSRAMPAGSDGETDHDVTVPPVDVGV
tara:strand:- start:756 stop:1115 length:360 start_codon:yes stop_codon:yes gene_type:complete